jgi:prepilin-type N-terminal cleavage/methylation domain-containing protein
MRKQSGFSLIELLIVVAIILIIAAIAIPNLMRAKISANEAAAVSSVRSVTTAQVAYMNTYSVGYADDLLKLGPPSGGGAVSSTSAGLLDWLQGCTAQPCYKSGYNFRIANAVGTNPTVYDVFGAPVSVGNTGARGFCSGHRMVLTADPAGGTACTQVIQ